MSCKNALWTQMAIMMWSVLSWCRCVSPQPFPFSSRNLYILVCLLCFPSVLKTEKALKCEHVCVCPGRCILKCVICKPEHKEKKIKYHSRSENWMHANDYTVCSIVCHKEQLKTDHGGWGCGCVISHICGGVPPNLNTSFRLRS